MSLVELHEQHKEILLLALLGSLDAKQQIIRKERWILTKEEYINAGEKIIKGVKWSQPNKNLFTWLKDQLHHSKGMNTDLKDIAIFICDHAQFGPVNYKRFLRDLESGSSTFKDLFDEE
jgi:hypothetical protein